MTLTKSKVSISGNTLMTNTPSSVEITPNNGEGIVFKINSGEVKANAHSVVSTQNCTVLASQTAQIGLVEHFMAALAFCNVTDIDVNVSNTEMPILDGSAKEWVELFEKSGLKKDITERYTVKEPVYFVKDKTTIVVLPSEEFSLTYCIDFTNGELNNRWQTLTKENIEDAISARTFGYYKDLEKFQAMGLALGVNENNTIGLTENGYTTELRCQYEPLKHKILDLIGDFYLTGINPLEVKMQVIAKNAGHFSHVEMAKLLKDKFVKLEK